jgi:hypothetical protein
LQGDNIKILARYIFSYKDIQIHSYEKIFVKNSDLLNNDLPIKTRMDGTFIHQNGKDFLNITLNTPPELVEI